MPDFEQIGVQAVIAGMAQFRSDAAAYTRGILDMTGVTKLSSAGIDALGQVAIGAERELGRLAVSFVRLANEQLIHFVEGLVSAGAAGTSFISATQTLQSHLEGIAQVQLSPLFDQLGQLVTKASPAIEAFTQYALGAFSDLASNAVGWGENVVNQFAQGMWDAVSAVVEALTNIANMVAYFLAPGSPPRLLPDIDDWGKGAMQAYLDGWAQADFGVFNELSGTIESYLKSLSADSKDTGLIPRILGAREAIAEAVDQARQTGVVTVDSLNKIYAAAGATTKGMQDYVKSVFNLELANANVSKAQDALNQVTKEYDALLKPVSDKLGQVSEAQKQLAEDSEISQLKLVAADPNAGPAEKRQAQLEIERLLTERQQRALVAQKGAAVDAAQAKLDAAKKGADAAQAQFDAQKSLMALQTQQNELIKQQIQLLESLNKAAGGGGGPKPASGKGGGAGVKPFSSGLDLGSFIPDGIKAKLGDLVAAFESAWAAIVKALQPAVDAWNNLVVPAWNRLVKAFLDSGPKIEAVIADIVAFAVKTLGSQLPVAFNNLATSLDTLTHVWQTHGDTVLGVVDFIARLVTVTLVGAFTLGTAVITASLQLLAAFMDALSAVIKGNWLEAWRLIAVGFALAGLTLLATADAFMHSIASIVNLNLDQIRADWAGTWELINVAVDAVLMRMSKGLDAWLVATSSSLVKWFGEILAGFSGWGASIEKIVGDMFGALTAAFALFSDIFKGNWGALGSDIANIFRANMQAAADFFTSITATIIGNIQGVLNFIGSLVNAIKGIPGIPGVTGAGSSPTAVTAPAVSSSSSSYTYAPQYNLGGVTTSRSTASVTHEFAVMQSMAGVPS